MLRRTNFMDSVINSLLKRAYKYGYSCKLHTIENIASEADKSLLARSSTQYEGL